MALLSDSVTKHYSFMTSHIKAFHNRFLQAFGYLMDKNGTQTMVSKCKEILFVCTPIYIWELKIQNELHAQKIEF